MGGSPNRAPAIKSVHGLDPEAERELQALYQDKPVTSAAMKTREAKIREALIRFINRAIPRSTRIWLCGHVIVTHEGKLYRPERDSVTIDRAFNNETGHDPQEPSDDHPAFKEYLEATHSMGGATGYRFKKWLRRETFAQHRLSTVTFGKRRRLSPKSGTARTTLRRKLTHILICALHTYVVRTASLVVHQMQWMWCGNTVSLRTCIVVRMLGEGL